MKTVNRNSIFAYSIFLVISLTAGCDKPYTVVPSGEESHNIGAKPFQGEIYRSVDNRAAITIVSPDELELHENGTNLICKYTKQDSRLRVVANIMGTPQALYYDVLPTGVRGKDGMILFNSENYQRITTAIRETNERKAKEEANLIAQIAVAKKQTREIEKTGSIQGIGCLYTITDVSIIETDLNAKSAGREYTMAFLFNDLIEIGAVERGGYDSFTVRTNLAGRNGVTVILASREACVEFRKSLLIAYNEWKAKFPNLAHAVIP